MVDIYPAFGNSVRNKLIICLSGNPKNVTELINSCELAQSAVSQHLSKLKKLGIVDSAKKGKQVIYSLKYPQAADISILLSNLAKKVEK